MKTSAYNLQAPEQQNHRENLIMELDSENAVKCREHGLTVFAWKMCGQSNLAEAAWLYMFLIFKKQFIFIFAI